MGGMKQDLAETLTSLQRALAFDYRIVQVPVPDAPIFLAAALPLSPTVTGLKPRLPSGRGLSLAQALVSAGAEALELRSSLAQNNRATIAALPRQNGRAVVVARDLLSGAAIQVPAQEVYLDFAALRAEVPSCDARSTGCATAATADEAARLALFECIERDAIALWWHGGVVASALPNDLLDAKAPRLAWWLERRPRRFQLLGLGGDIGLPVVLAVSSDPLGRHVAYGAAARFDMADAALAAVTEMIQTEVSFARALAAGNPEAMAWQDHASTLTLAQFDPPHDGPPAAWAGLDDLALLQRLAALGLCALAVDLSLPGDPLPSLRVLVPGLCDMGGRIDQPRFRQAFGPAGRPRPHDPEPF